MIYWEYVNPRFSVDFRQDADCDVWQWEDPEGWTHGEMGMEFSPAFSAATVNLEVLSRLGESGYQDYLVIYGRDPASPLSWVVALVGTNDRSMLPGFGVQPPEWYVPLESKSPLELMIDRINSLEEVVRHIRARDSRYVYQTPTELLTTVAGYCSGCGLPNDKHVPHKVPDFENGAIDADRVKAYYQAFKQHYGGALEQMTEAEILQMPLPPNVRNLRVLRLDIQRRMANVTPPKSAIDRLLDDDEV